MSPTPLLQRIASRNAVVGVIGLGYVGLPLALRFSEEKFRVIGFDIDAGKVAELQSGRSYLGSIDNEQIAQALSNGFTSTCDYAMAAEADALIICVPTPLTQHREPDLSYVTRTLNSLLPHTRRGQVLSLESTTYPGTTEEILMPLLEAHGYTVGENYFLVYSPEREDPGNPNFSTRSIPKVCSGQTANCLAVGQALYGQVIDNVVPVSSTKAAEMTKLLENIYRAVNIGLVNEMKIVADKMGINIHEVIDAAATKPFGFTKFTPGPGLGGHCIPIDPFYLTWKAKEYGVNTRFIELAGEVNRSMPQWVVEKTTDALNSLSKPLRGSRILILGLAYKKNVDDCRESPAAEILELLANKGAEVAYSDPLIRKFPKMRGHTFDLQSVALSEETLNTYDCAVLVTDHDDFDYALLERASIPIVDTRNRLKSTTQRIVA